MALELTILAIASIVDDAFESLFFGTGAWLGLLIFMSICVSLALVWKYFGVFIIIIIVLFEVEYYNRLDIYGNHIWKMIILLFFAIFIAWLTLTKAKGR